MNDKLAAAAPVAAIVPVSNIQMQAVCKSHFQVLHFCFFPYGSGLEVRSKTPFKKSEPSVTFLVHTYFKT